MEQEFGFLSTPDSKWIDSSPDPKDQWPESSPGTRRILNFTLQFHLNF